MTERLTRSVFYQDTVREYSCEFVHETFPDNRRASLLSSHPLYVKKAYCNQEDMTLQYRDFTHRIFKDSNVLNEAWQNLNVQQMNLYCHEGYYSSGNGDDNILCQIAERIILKLASQSSAKKILMDILKKGPAIYYHSIEVMCMSMTMAQCIGYDKESIYEIGMAAVLHDIGKVLLPDELLHLTKDPNDEQKQKLEKVPVLSAAMTKKTGFYTTDIINGILSHQENYIGTGYPFAKMQQEIHPYGTLIHVADDYDTIVLRKKGQEYAKNYIRKMTCRRYSFSAVNAFNDSFK